MEIENLFINYHSRLLPSEAILERARQSCEYIKQVLTNEGDLAPLKFYYSGSYAKATHIDPLKDVDLVLYYSLDDWHKSDGKLYSPGIVVGRLFARMFQLHGSRLTIRRQNRSVGIRFRDFDVDIVPALWDGNEQHLALIPDRESNKWMITSIPLHLEFLKNRDKTYRPYAKTIRIVKAWKRSNRVNVPGFALELLTVKALDTYGTSGNLAVCFYRVLNYIYETKLRKPVYFTDYFKENKIDVEARPVIIVDPVNPRNNVTHSLNHANRLQMLRKVEKTLRRADHAFKAEESGNNRLAHRWWFSVFKEPFPKPRPVQKSNIYFSLFR